MSVRLEGVGTGQIRAVAGIWQIATILISWVALCSAIPARCSATLGAHADTRFLTIVADELTKLTFVARSTRPAGYTRGLWNAHPLTVAFHVVAGTAGISRGREFIVGAFRIHAIANFGRVALTHRIATLRALAQYISRALDR